MLSSFTTDIIVLGLSSFSELGCNAMFDISIFDSITFYLVGGSTQGSN